MMEQRVTVVIRGGVRRDGADTGGRLLRTAAAGTGLETGSMVGTALIPPAQGRIQSAVPQMGPLGLE